MTTVKEPRIYVCGVCGSPNLLWDANAYWNPRTQAYELGGVFDACLCGGCNNKRRHPRSRHYYGTDTAILISDRGRIEFEIETGAVVAHKGDFGLVPVAVDVAEWRKRYPSEDLNPETYDILDFRVVASNGDALEPDEDWRKRREKDLAQQRLEDLR